RPRRIPPVPRHPRGPSSTLGPQRGGRAGVRGSDRLHRERVRARLPASQPSGTRRSELKRVRVLCPSAASPLIDDADGKQRRLRAIVGASLSPALGVCAAAQAASCAARVACCFPQGGESLITSAILGKGAAGLVAVVLAVGGGSAVAMAATGSHNPEEL